MKRFKPVPPEPKKIQPGRTRFVNADIKGLEERFFQARLKYGLGTAALVKQMVEYCLDDLEEQELENLDPDSPPDLTSFKK